MEYKEYKTEEDLKYYYTRNKERYKCCCGKSPYKNDAYSHNKTRYHRNNKDYLNVIPT
jgi:hypothetical protein